MAHDPFYPKFDPRYSPSRDIREEYDNLRRQLYDTMQELNQCREKVGHATAASELAKTEATLLRQYVKVLELALYIASETDEKKAEVLDQAKKSIEVLKIFEK